MLTLKMILRMFVEQDDHRSNVITLLKMPSVSCVDNSVVSTKCACIVKYVLDEIHLVLHIKSYLL